MRVKDLKAVLNGVADDAEVLLSYPDRCSYDAVKIAEITRVNRGKGAQQGEWWEFEGEDDQLPGCEMDVVLAVVIPLDVWKGEVD